MVLFNIQIGIIAKRWAKGFGREDKDARKEKNMYMCVHT
jgi:hypothetical protein